MAAKAGPTGGVSRRTFRRLIEISNPRAAGSSPRLSKHGRRPGFPDHPIGLLSRRISGEGPSRLGGLEYCNRDTPRLLPWRPLLRIHLAHAMESRETSAPLNRIAHDHRL